MKQAIMVIVNAALTDKSAPPMASVFLSTAPNVISKIVDNMTEEQAGKLLDDVVSQLIRIRDG